jgi:hypothetical protein
MVSKVWMRQTEARSERIASISLLLIGTGCLAGGYWWPTIEGAKYVLWIGVAFLALFVKGLVFRSRSTITIDQHKREINCQSSNGFRNKAETYPFPELVRVDLQTYKVPEEESTASLSLHFRDGHRAFVPEVYMHNAESLAQEIVQITGAKLTEEHFDTSRSLFGRR